MVVDTKGFPLGFRAENTRLYDEKATTLCSGTRPGFCNGVLMSVDTSHADDVARIDSVTAPLQARDYKGGKLVCAVDCRNATEADVNGALQSSSAHNINSNNTVRHYTVVRRLTPLECERLQGFPDGWTQIGELVGYERITDTDNDGTDEYVYALYEYIDENGKKKKTNDGARYKALGNSIAIPPWFYVLMKLNLCCGTDNTMASLFDGIGGFPLIWEMLNGTGSCLWASEIEDFPIAVTKTRFYEEDA